jgi:hypothetical protein
MYSGKCARMRSCLLAIQRFELGARNMRLSSFDTQDHHGSRIFCRQMKQFSTQLVFNFFLETGHID